MTTDELVLINEDSEIKKSEALVKSRYKLKPLAVKLITSLISAVQDKDTPNQEYIFNISNFTELGDLKGNDYYFKLKEACYEILSKPIEIGKKGSKDFKIMSWVHTCEYVHNEAVIKFKISDTILPYIINLKKGNYLKYDLENILKLRGNYSIRIYELLKDEYNKNARYGKKAETIITIEELRNMLEIPKSYRYDNIKQQILIISQENLLKYTDIKFDFEEIKLSRKVHQIKFKIYPNGKNIKKDTKLPAYLENFMKYKNYLNDKYLGNGKYFIISKFDINNKKEVYLFGINNKGLVYATSQKGGNSINLTKAQAQTIRNASYLCALHSELYRELIADNVDFWEFSKDTDNKEFFGIVIQSINSVLKEFDARAMPLI